MDEVSKKELLAITGISYGQLYRWKREGLIPEEWFIKRSAYTGQETFFPRERIIKRVETITELKDRFSLDQIRAHLANTPTIGTTREALLGAANADPTFVDELLSGGAPTEQTLPILAIAVAVFEGARDAAIERSQQQALASKALALSDGHETGTEASDNGAASGDDSGAGASVGGASDGVTGAIANDAPLSVTLFSIGGDYHFCLTRNTDVVGFDRDIVVLARKNTADIIERLRSAALA